MFLFIGIKQNHTIEIIIMKILLALVMVCSVLVLGYASYVDSKNKKRQEITKIVNDAEHSLNTIQHNANYVNSTHISSSKHHN